MHVTTYVTAAWDMPSGVAIEPRDGRGAGGRDGGPLSQRAGPRITRSLVTDLSSASLKVWVSDPRMMDGLNLNTHPEKVEAPESGRAFP